VLRTTLSLRHSNESREHLLRQSLEHAKIHLNYAELGRLLYHFHGLCLQHGHDEFGLPLLEPEETAEATGEEETEDAAAELVPTGPSAAAPTPVLSPAEAAEIPQQAKPALAAVAPPTTTPTATASTMVNPWTRWRPHFGSGAAVYPMPGKSGQPLSFQPVSATDRGTGTDTPFTVNLAPKAKGL